MGATPEAVAPSKLLEFERRRAEFAAARPFPHVVLDDFLPESAADALLTQFAQPADGWTYYHHVNERKRGYARLKDMPAPARSVIESLMSADFLHALERLSGVGPLIADPELDGGGLHETEPGGFLNVHTDFLSHTTRSSWSRQLNLLLFLNRNWQEP